MIPSYPQIITQESDKAMNNILKAWNAGFVRRWHTHPVMVDTHDPDNAHQQRCTVLLLLFWPDSTREAIIDCLVHDQGECDSGDMARPAKEKYPQIAVMLQNIEDESIKEQGFEFFASDLEVRRRKFVDLLDSYIWMLRNKPILRHRPEWREQALLLDHWAISLEIFGEYNDFLSAASYFYVENYGEQ